MKLSYHLTDFIFRMLFSLIFIGLGFEHIFSSDLIIKLMPEWIIYKQMTAVLTGFVLLGGGISILVGCKVHQGAWVLLVFLIVVTATVHLPAVFSKPEGLPENWRWLWNIYQRSNLVKNLCLIGVCLHLTNHETGKYSMRYFLGLGQNK